jgi:hypothetical protein
MSQHLVSMERVREFAGRNWRTEIALCTGSLSFNKRQSHLQKSMIFETFLIMLLKFDLLVSKRLSCLATVLTYCTFDQFSSLEDGHIFRVLPVSLPSKNLLCHSHIGALVKAYPPYTSAEKWNVFRGSFLQFRKKSDVYLLLTCLCHKHTFRL